MACIFGGNGMAERLIFVCSCEDSMAPDAAAIAAASGAETRGAEQLCRRQLDRFLSALDSGPPAITVACRQEAPLFAQEAEAAGFAGSLTFADIREAAGWSDEGAKAGPKMAALLAAAAVPMPETPLVSLESKGVTLLLGRDATALAAADALKDRLDLTVLLTGEEPVEPPRRSEVPVMRGRVRAATGWLGAFEAVVDGFAAPSPASRAQYAWGPSKDGAKSRADLILDLTGAAPLFPAHEGRQGYLRADPKDAAAVERLVRQAADLTGVFDKPRFVQFDSGLCAHSRNRKVGCSRCLDLCPTGAITPPDGKAVKDHVLISAEICAGCGACAAVCPTGAASYSLPPADAVLKRLRALLLTYHQAGGRDPVLLLHDQTHGEALIDALARHGSGLPARALPFALNETTQADLSFFAAAFAYGASAVRVLGKGRRGEGWEGMARNLDYANAVLGGLGLAGPAPRAAAIETDDPFSLGEALRAIPAMPLGIVPAGFLPMGTPRELALTAFRALRDAARAPAAAIALPDKAPFGLARVATSGCTLCLACTMVCPTGAFAANPDTPQLSFLEDACVQCGLCAATCPEKVITLEPRLNLAPEASERSVVKEEAPWCCPRCSKAFGMKSSIERVKAKLVATGHWMFADPKRLSLLELCEDCRAIEATSGGIDPFAGPERPIVKTTEDYLREAERAKRREQDG
jgi:ferredoxin